MFIKKKILKIASKNEDQRFVWVSKKLKELSSGLKILDVGSGERPFQKFCGHLNYVSQDSAKYDGIGDVIGLQTGSWNRDNIDIISDIIKIPEPDNSFDAILCTEVIEHVPDPIKALEELTRLLKPGGIIILTAPFISMAHFSPFHFCTGFNKYFYIEHLKRLGLKIDEIKPSGNFFDVMMQQLITMPSISKKYSRNFLVFLQWFFIIPLLLLLKITNRYQNNSEEILCFEYFVKAIKK
ncbi:MAG: hypothetical protein COU42_00590 [Candidatus Nealsonbacteria bacterium CG10_big_fil_rev_8_21_14_0_10_36_24]|uniref:Methyltransferase type 11 domain-containing protein n=1 Tax=Candidatus Nealsonbacteria bacterium CG10_big_fil_rev_8_21_14_0_10_36_24 TaxID=1974710 RepID=A0A2M6NSY9_9BACT|nr:MAG: hypothetical protein COU42_00590 [Candidatus Nealsonbacteria bacterium CG10_big_fil_rev_8_21_14_0_10_36_24]